MHNSEKFNGTYNGHSNWFNCPFHFINDAFHSLLLVLFSLSSLDMFEIKPMIVKFSTVFDNLTEKKHTQQSSGPQASIKWRRSEEKRKRTNKTNNKLKPVFWTVTPFFRDVQIIGMVFFFCFRALCYGSYVLLIFFPILLHYVLCVCVRSINKHNVSWFLNHIILKQIRIDGGESSMLNVCVLINSAANGKHNEDERWISEKKHQQQHFPEYYLSTLN